ncbi:MAG: hypothetical protein AB7T59_10110 [Hyphomonadaceae bacterium]
MAATVLAGAAAMRAEAPAAVVVRARDERAAAAQVATASVWG